MHHYYLGGFLLLQFFLLTSCNNSVAPDTGEVSLTQPSNLSKKNIKLKFIDKFEKDKGWGIFEEIVGGSVCYGDNIGEVIRSTDVPFKGAYSLRVWANKAQSTKSNHVIGQNKISETGHTGKWRYSVRAYIPENNSATGTAGETGPEISMQNTREISPGEFRTTTAGIQYQANPFSTEGNWAIWSEQSPGVAGWQVFTTQRLVPGTWYKIVLKADFVINKYIRLIISGGKGADRINLSIDLSEYQIAQEEKFSEEAFWLTLESENLFNNCGTAGVFDYKVYYDNVRLKPIN